MTPGRKFTWAAAIALVITGLLLGSCEARTGNRVQAPPADHAGDAGTEAPYVGKVPLVAGERLKVVATTSMIGDVVNVVGGEAIQLSTLMPRGQNPHAYDPPPSAFRTLERADLIFVNGFGLESGMLDTIASVATGVVVPISAGVPVQEESADQHGHGEINPHVWMDPNNVRMWVDNTVEVLSRADPGNAAVYASNGSAYAARLTELDTLIRDGVAGIPVKRRRIVVDHESVSYFARAYGFQIIGAVVPGTTDSAEPSPSEVAQLVDLIQREGVRTIFVGATTSRGLQALSTAIATEAGGDVRLITILTGSLAPKGQPGDTYLGFMQYNLAQILSGLQE
ncbi:MAG: zinc ABC transporter substrate-binding protein [Spirochaetales bacterium]|nr:MAG: zinc ABC transporter substrate-binding protein [Spirochaetales bacterium]